LVSREFDHPEHQLSATSDGQQVPRPNCQVRPMRDEEPVTAVVVKLPSCLMWRNSPRTTRFTIVLEEVVSRPVDFEVDHDGINPIARVYTDSFTVRAMRTSRAY
jgi:hypothetical protein